LHQYYLDGIEATHKGWDSGEKTAYRKMKDECLEAHGDILKANLKRYEDTGDYFIPFPRQHCYRDPSTVGACTGPRECSCECSSCVCPVCGSTRACNCGE
jgi:hypothetical protein